MSQCSDDIVEDLTGVTLRRIANSCVVDSSGVISEVGGVHSTLCEVGSRCFRLCDYDGSDSLVRLIVDGDWIDPIAKMISRAYLLP